MRYKFGHIAWMICTGMVLVLGGCADDSTDTAERRMYDLRLVLGYSSFADDGNGTRAAGDLPPDFEAYSHGSLQQIKQILCYMTYEKNGESDSIPCLFNHITTDESTLGHIWTSRVPLYTLDPGSKYYVYGVMPREDVEGSVTLKPYDDNITDQTAPTYSKGVVMTLSGLNAVTPNDICVIVGAAGYDGTPANIPDMRNRLGVFDYSPDNDCNSLFLLIDHIYAGLKFNMKLDANYSKLRGINVKSVKLIPKDGNNKVIKTVDAVVTVVAKATLPPSVEYKNPIVPIYSGAGSNIGGSVVFPTDRFKYGTDPKPAIIYEGEGKKLSSVNQEFLACLCPATNKNFILETTYDVYDRYDNLIREGEKAYNSITLEQDLTSGEVHTVNITVKPTFLFMLSEPDLDSPTFSLEN